LIYLDHHATTPVDPRVLEAMLPYFTDDYGNASSHTHRFGWRADAALEVARETVAEGIGASEAREVIFTSGATESDNLAIQGVFNAAGRGHIVTVSTEHAAVLDTCSALARRGASVTLVPVDAEGFVDPDEVAAAITDETALVSVMAANSEIGTIAPLARIGELTAERGALFHCDAAQAVGKIPLDVEALGIDLLSVSAHKVYGPKGVGALYVRRRRRASGKRIRIEPLVHGGGHERGLRSGTVPVPLVVGLGRAVELGVAGALEESARVGTLRDRLWSGLEKQVGEVALNGPRSGDQRLAGNLNVSFVGIEADALISQLPDLALSTGSACASAKPELSHVLRACCHDDARIRGSVRFGLGRQTTEAEIVTAVGRICEEVARLRAAAPRAVASDGADR
jgi:cysteine desulfurase